MVEKVAPAARALDLFEDSHRMHIIAGESIGAQAQYPIDHALAKLVPQSIESGAVEGCATLAIVAEDRLSPELLSCAFEMGLKALDLLINGWSEGLPVGRDADRDGACHMAPPLRS